MQKCRANAADVTPSFIHTYQQWCGLLPSFPGWDAVRSIRDLLLQVLHSRRGVTPGFAGYRCQTRYRRNAGGSWGVYTN